MHRKVLSMIVIDLTGVIALLHPFLEIADVIEVHVNAIAATPVATPLIVPEGVESGNRRHVDQRDGGAFVK